MHDDAIPSHVIAFVVEHVSSVIQLEVLLLLHAHRDRSYTADELGKELRVNGAWVDSQAQILVSNGILITAGDQPRRYQYRPKSPQLDQAVAELARVYEERRVSVITLIFNKPVDQAQSFADAFRLRRGDGHG